MQNFSCKFIVPEVDYNNPPYNHVHHADIIRYLEKGREEYVRSLGFPLETLHARGFFPVVSQLDIRYLRELRGGELQISSKLHSKEKRLFYIEQVIVNPNGKDAVRALVGLMFIDIRLRVGIPMPEDFAAALC